jgi:hypothetical protein
MIDKSHPKLFFLDIEKASKPISDICNVWVDHWWIVDPERGLAFYNQGPEGAPQCNRDKRVTEMVHKTHYPWAEMRQIPIVYKRIMTSYE